MDVISVAYNMARSMLSAMKPTRCGGLYPNKAKSMTDRESRTRAVRILAKSIYKDLQVQGFDEKQIVALATELISEVTNTISKDSSRDEKAHATA